MKGFLVICILYTIVNEKWVWALEDRELKYVAEDLLKDIAGLLTNVTNVRKDLVNVAVKFNKERDSIDFGLPQNQQIIKLQEILRNDSNDKIGDCKDLYKNQINNVTQELSRLFTENVKMEMRNHDLILYGTEQDLLKLRSNLQNENLDKAIQICKSGTEICKLTEEYTRDVFRLKLVVNNLTNRTHFLIEYVLQTIVMPSVPKKVSDIVSLPVTECLNKFGL